MIGLEGPAIDDHPCGWYHVVTTAGQRRRARRRYDCAQAPLRTLFQYVDELARLAGYTDEVRHGLRVTPVVDGLKSGFKILKRM